MTSPTPVEIPDYVQGHSLLAGRTVVVTAAAGAGIGAAAAKRCLEEDAKAVIIGDIHERRLDAVATSLSEEFGSDRVASVLSDVSSEEQVQALLDAAEPFGGVDVLINNAGLGGHASILDMTDDEWSRVIDVPRTGGSGANRAPLRPMAAQGKRGAVVNNPPTRATRPLPGQA